MLISQENVTEIGFTIKRSVGWPKVIDFTLLYLAEHHGQMCFRNTNHSNYILGPNGFRTPFFLP